MIRLLTNHPGALKATRLALNKPPSRLSDDEIAEARRLWTEGRNTVEIAHWLEIPEAWLWNQPELYHPVST